MVTQSNSQLKANIRPAVDSEPLRILMIEDNWGDVVLTQETIEDLGIPCHLHVVENGREAFAYLRRQGGYRRSPPPDLIILDLSLPDRPGREILKEIKQDPKLARIPVIVCTGSDSEKDILEVYDLNANCFITKPVFVDEFIAMIKSIQNFWSLPGARLPRTSL